MNNAIQKAIEGGYKSSRQRPSLVPNWTVEQIDSTLLDPLFWQYLGKAMGWNMWNTDIPQWKFHWHNFIDDMIDGKTPDEFFNNLIPTK